MAVPERQASSWFWNGKALGSGENIKSNILDVRGCDELVGRVNRATTSYDVQVEWLDNEDNVIFTEDIATGVAGGTATDLDDNNNFVPARAINARIVVKDAGSGSGAVDAVIHAK